VRKAGPQSETEGLRIGLAAVQPGTGEVIAMYGGRDYIEDQINNATQQFAQAGSTFKPFALAAAADQQVSLASTYDGSSPQTIKGYTLTNYGDKSYGYINLLTATENSVNTAYVNLEDQIGVDSVADAALRAGIPEDTPGLNLDNLDLTFVLGTASPSGLDVANAYATFAASGIRATPTVVKKVVGSNGGVLYEYSPDLTSQFTADTANTVSYALAKVVTNGTAFAAMALDRPAAAKTGTTDGNKSAWFAGYTPQLSTAVLMAKEIDGVPVSLSGTGGLGTVTGGSFPAAIWTAFMKAALEGMPVAEFPAPPEGVEVAQICPEVMPLDGSDIPVGCPTPAAIEFEPSAIPSDIASSDPFPVDSAPAVPGDPAATPVPVPTPTPTPSPTPPGIDGAPAQR
jgi:membrane peptidoglycan carboxypeptidase